ncbi:MAG: hypothetical protein WCH46_00450 [bacterium]
MKRFNRTVSFTGFAAVMTLFFSEGFTTPPLDVFLIGRGFASKLLPVVGASVIRFRGVVLSLVRGENGREGRDDGGRDENGLDDDGLDEPGLDEEPLAGKGRADDERGESDLGRPPKAGLARKLGALESSRRGLPTGRRNGSELCGKSIFFRGPAEASLGRESELRLIGRSFEREKVLRGAVPVVGDKVSFFFGKPFGLLFLGDGDDFVNGN